MKIIMKNNKLVCPNDIHIAKDFQPFAEHMTSQAHHAAAIEKFNYYPRPVGYERDAKCYILGQHPSVDAALKNNLDEIEVDLIDPDTDTNQFMAVFLSKEHLNRKARVAYIKMVVNYLRTDAGKVWAKESFNTKDIEDILVELTDKSASSIKHLLKLIKPEYKAILDKYCNDELSLYQAYQLCVEADKETRSKPTDKPNVQPKVEAKPEKKNTPTAVISTDQTSSEQTDFVEAIDNGDSSTAVDKQKDAPPVPTLKGSQTITTIDAAEALNNFGVKNLTKVSSNSFIKKAILELTTGEQMEITGTITLSVDGIVLSSTESLHKLENGMWTVPNNCKTYNLAVYKAA